MESWREELDLLKAQLTVQQMALCALVHSHPHPPSVLDEWRKLRADGVAAAYNMPADPHAAAWRTEAVQRLAAEWLAELVLAATRHGAREAPDGDVAASVPS